jgi:hypothetical protein
MSHVGVFVMKLALFDHGFLFKQINKTNKTNETNNNKTNKQNKTKVQTTNYHFVPHLLNILLSQIFAIHL